jgi:hypothetical protein
VFFGSAHERSVALILTAIGASGWVLALRAGVGGKDYFLGRNVLVSIVPFAVVVGIGLGTERMRWLGAAVAVALCLVWVGIVADVATDASRQKADWREVARVVERGPRRRVVVLQSYLGSPILRYLDDARALPAGKRARIDAIDLVYRIPDSRTRCGRWSGLGCETFLFPRMPKSLERDFGLVDRREFSGFVVNRYRSERPHAVSTGLLLKNARELRGLVVLPWDRLHTYRVEHHRSNR